jgi:hypothetical protein
VDRWTFEILAHGFNPLVLEGVFFTTYLELTTEPIQSQELFSTPHQKISKNSS